ncbi:uncharacterized protein [Magallana gigas]|uniref:uncharacterized protein n=1 Tax=Magallana gigas TaxID=29159 RepID=UPI003340D20C
MYNYTSYEDDYNYPAVEYRYTSYNKNNYEIFPWLIFILIPTVVTGLWVCSCYCCYKRGIRQGQKLNQENDQQEETAQYQSQNIEFPNQENAYETPCQPTNTCETSQKQELELAAYEEIKENRFKWLQYQNIGEDVYLTPVTQQKPLPSGN